MVHVFITGGSGLIGRSTVRSLLAADHKVTALSRSDKSTATLKELGVSDIVHGTILDLDVVQTAASKADAVIHLGFNHDLFATGQAALACEQDRGVIAALCNGLVASPSTGDKVFINSSGVLGNKGPDETADKLPNPMIPRHLSEELTASYRDKGLRTINARFAPVTYGPDYPHMFIELLAAAAKKSGYAAIVGDGDQVWPAAHADDVGELLALALVKAPSGNIHGLVEQGVKLADIAALIAKKLDLPTKNITSEQAGSELGFVGHLIALGKPASNDLTKEWTGWQPKEGGLLEQMESWQL